MKNIIILICVVLVATSCASNIPLDKCLPMDVYGFFGGLWHGFISPISFIGSIFNDDIVMYASNNNGVWYDLGFISAMFITGRYMLRTLGWAFLISMSLLGAILSKVFE
jgi:hypothetical protein